MKPTLIPKLVLGLLMLASAGAAKVTTPTVRLSEVLPPLPLESVIPTRFGDWSQELQTPAQVVDPQLQDELKRIYTQIISRTYVNARSGERIMLSIAYGRDQSDTTQVHYPEICYPAQGFQVTSNNKGVLNTADGAIAVRRLETNLDSQRYEPVTYWTTVGDRVVNNRIDKKLAEMHYGFQGEIPDGLLFRVSAINRDSAAAFRTEDAFVADMEKQLDRASRLRLMGF